MAKSATCKETFIASPTSLAKQLTVIVNNEIVKHLLPISVKFRSLGNVVLKGNSLEHSDYSEFRKLSRAHAISSLSPIHVTF